MANGETAIFSINCPMELLKKIDEEAEKSNRSRSAEIVYQLNKIYFER